MQGNVHTRINYLQMQIKSKENTVSSLQYSYTLDDNEEYWCFLKYQVIIEYNDKPPLPPPFNLLHFFLFLPFRLFFPRLLDGYSHAVGTIL